MEVYRGDKWAGGPTRERGEREVGRGGVKRGERGETRYSEVAGRRWRGGRVGAKDLPGRGGKEEVERKRAKARDRWREEEMVVRRRRKRKTGVSAQCGGGGGGKDKGGEEE